MKPFLPFTRNKKNKLWGTLSVFFTIFLGLVLIRRHWPRRHKIMYFGASALILSTTVTLGLNFSSFTTTDILKIPSQYNNPVQIATVQPKLQSYLWYPMRVCYAESSCGAINTNIPVGWPNNLTDSNTISGSGVKNIIWGTLYLHYSFTTADPKIIAMLDWAQSVGMKVNLDDQGAWTYISRGTYIISDMQTHVQRMIQLYGSHPALAGWYMGNEPEGWGATALQKEGMYARYGQMTALYKQYDPNHQVFSSTASASKLRFCREGQPTHLHNSGFSTFRDGNQLVDETSQAFQDVIDRTIYNFDEDYLCTENYNIPFNYSLAANYWRGDTITAPETTMYAYLLLAHGGQGIEWFPYSTDGGLVWDNQAPLYSQNFVHWLPAMHGGLIYLDAKYRSVNGFANITLATDATIRRSGNYAARMDFAGPVFSYFNLRLNPTVNSKNPWNPTFPALKTGTSYTMKGWVKISGDAAVQLTASGPGFSTAAGVSGITDWVEITKTFTTPATSGKWMFGPAIVSATNGSVWFDDFSLVETADVTQRNLAAKYNPGFETVTGADRTPHEPLYSAVKQVQSDFSALNIFTQLKRIVTFDDLHEPSSGLVTAVSSAVSVGLPRVETGVFSTAASNGEYYLVVVNRNISSTAQISLTLKSTNSVTFNDLVSGSAQSYTSNGTQVSVSFSLPAGGGKAFRLQGVNYNSPTFNSVYEENFEDGLAQNWSTLGGVWSVVDDNGSKVYDINATTDARGIQTAVTVGDFEYSGKFKIMPDHSTASILHFSFYNTTVNGSNYQFRIQLDPGAASSAGYFQLVRTSQNSAVVCQINDENFFPGNRYIDFKIRGIGNVFEGWFDGLKYFTCIDNSSEAYTSGQVGFRIYSGGHVRLDDIAVKTLGTAVNSCSESWTCSAWTACSNSLQTRTCIDANACGTTFDRPALTQSCTQADTQAPSAVTDFSVVSTTAGSISLQWTAPGDDGSTGTATSYDLRYSIAPITATNFASATAVTNVQSPASAGTVQSITLSGFVSSTTYYFALKTSDEVPNTSSISNIVLATTLVTSDAVPPAAVTLSAIATTATSVTLQWTAPGDDGNVGTATQYDIRYSISELGAALFNNATQVIGEPVPLVAGTVQSMTVSGLTLGQTYYFVIKSSDEVPNVSGFTNILQVATADVTSPAATTNLAISTILINSAILTWTAPGDDGFVGTATSYDLRYSTSLITSANFASATSVTGEPTPTIAGTAQSMTVSGLASDTTYYFALKTADEVPNTSTISNIVSGSTTVIIPVDIILPATVANLAISSPTASSLRLSWTAPGDDGSVGTATSYDLRYSTSVITSANFASATSVTGEPTPTIAGTAQSMTVSGLASGTTYYFALKATDEALNSSVISNVVSGKTSAAACVESWGCSAWSSCANSQQTRTCSDSANCGTTINKPATTQSCSIVPGPIPGPGTGCVEDWICNDWSSCSANKQTRTCTDKKRCNASNTKNETRTCQENAVDTIAPATNSLVVPAVINQNWIKLILSGQDNQTSSAKLRFNYALNGAAKKTVIGSTVIIHNLLNGSNTIKITALDEANNEDATPEVTQFTVKNIQRIITIPRVGGPSLVRVFDYLGNLLSQFHAFSAFRHLGGSVALLDINNDGPEEIAVSPGKGGKPEVKIFDQSGKLLQSFMAYPENFRGGVNVASADLDGDGIKELITVPASGTGPLLRVFKPSGEMVAETSAFDRDFRGGVTISAGAIDDSGKALIAVAPASNGLPIVRLFALEGNALVLKATKEIATVNQPVGLSLTVGSINGKQNQIIASFTEGKQSPKVFILAGDLSLLKEFVAGKDNFTGGLQVASGDFENFDNLAEIIVGSYSGARQKIEVYSLGSDLNRLSPSRSFNPYGWSRFGINMVIGSL